MLAMPGRPFAGKRRPQAQRACHPHTPATPVPTRRLQELLRQRRSARDAAIAVALAYCDRSGDALEAGASASAACADLEAALELLERHGAAPQVQAEISQALEVGGRAARLLQGCW